MRVLLIGASHQFFPYYTSPVVNILLRELQSEICFTSYYLDRPEWHDKEKQQKKVQEYRESIYNYFAGIEIIDAKLTELAQDIDIVLLFGDCFYFEGEETEEEVKKVIELVEDIGDFIDKGGCLFIQKGREEYVGCDETYLEFILGNMLGIHFTDQSVKDSEHHVSTKAKDWVVFERNRGCIVDHPITKDINTISFGTYGGRTLDFRTDKAVEIILTDADADPPYAPVLATLRYKDREPIVYYSGYWTFSDRDDIIWQFDNRRLFENIIRFLMSQGSEKAPQYVEELEKSDIQIIETIKSLKRIYKHKIPIKEISKHIAKQFPQEFDVLYEDVMDLLVKGQLKGRIDSKGTVEREDDILIIESSEAPPEKVAKKKPVAPPKKVPEKKPITPKMSADDYLERGSEYFEQEHYKKAIAEFENAIKVDSNCYPAWGFIGLAYYQLEEPHNAIDSYKKAVKINPEFAAAWYNMGVAYWALGEHKKALDGFQKAVKIDPEYADAWGYMGIAYKEIGDYKKAIDSCEKALDIVPENAFLWALMGGAYKEIGEHTKALECFQQAVDLEPGDATTWFEMGEAYLNSEAYNIAIDFFKKAVELNPEDTTAWGFMGIAYYELGEHKNALDYFQQAVKLEPGFATAWAYMGSAYKELGEHKKAIDYFQKALELDPENAFTWYTMGSAHISLDEPKKALDCFQQAVKIDPEFADAWAYMGIVYKLLGKPTKTIESCEKALKLDPEDAFVWALIGMAYGELGEFKKALEYLQQSVELDPDDAVTWHNLGLVHKAMGKLKEAAKCFQKVVEIDPQYKL